MIILWNQFSYTASISDCMILTIFFVHVSTVNISIGSWIDDLVISIQNRSCTSSEFYVVYLRTETNSFLMFILFEWNQPDVGGHPFTWKRFLYLSNKCIQNNWFLFVDLYRSFILIIIVNLSFPCPTNLQICFMFVSFYSHN